MLKRGCLASAVALMLLGCGGSGATAPIDAAGEYTLTTVQGTPLPALIMSVPYGLTHVTFSQIELAAGGAYHDSTVLDNATQVDDGTWSASGGQVTITTPSWTVVASVSSSKLVVPFFGTPLGNYNYSYARQ